MSIWDNRGSSPLTPESFSDAIAEMLRPRLVDPEPFLVTPSQYARLQRYLAEPRLAHLSEYSLLCYAIADVSPPLRTASYRMGKSLRRRARRERRRRASTRVDAR